MLERLKGGALVCLKASILHLSWGLYCQEVGFWLEMNNVMSSNGKKSWNVRSVGEMGFARQSQQSSVGVRWLHNCPTQTHGCYTCKVELKHRRLHTELVMITSAAIAVIVAALIAVAAGRGLPAAEAAAMQPLLSATSAHLASMAAAGYRTLVVAGGWRWGGFGCRLRACLAHPSFPIIRVSSVRLLSTGLQHSIHPYPAVPHCDTLALLLSWMFV